WNQPAHGEGAAAHYGTFQGLGTLQLDFPANNAPVHDYRRSLDLRYATSQVSYEQGGVHYRRTLFVSAPDQVIAPGAIVHADRAGVHVRDGTDVTVLVSAATDYDGFAGRHTADPLAASAADLQRVAGRSADALHAAHVADFRRWFDRVALQLGASDRTREQMPTDARLAAYVDGKDPGFAALYFQYARYLLISSSRPGGLPANLQGLWAEGTSTPWNGDYHTNVNIEMNYWPAESTGLGELAQPLFAL